MSGGFSHEVNTPVPQYASGPTRQEEMKEVQEDKASVLVAISSQPANTGCAGLYPLFLSMTNKTSGRIDLKHQQSFAVDHSPRLEGVLRCQSSRASALTAREN